LARSFGAHAAKAPDYESFVTAVSEARSREGIKLIEVKADANFLSPGKRL
jgi:thiamine pyrophosphate-dependent acetolactate synthase large subunit-like protein